MFRPLDNKAPLTNAVKDITVQSSAYGKIVRNGKKRSGNKRLEALTKRDFQVKRDNVWVRQTDRERCEWGWTV